MSSSETKEDRQRRAFCNAVGACNFERMLPDQLFVGAWESFLFFQSDYIFAADFVDVLGGLLHLEGAHTAFLLNLDKTEVLEFESAAAMFIEPTMDGAGYEENLRAG